MDEDDGEEDLVIKDINTVPKADPQAERTNDLQHQIFGQKGPKVQDNATGDFEQRSINAAANSNN